MKIEDYIKASPIVALLEEKKHNLESIEKAYSELDIENGGYIYIAVYPSDDAITSSVGVSDTIYEFAIKELKREIETLEKQLKDI